MTNKKKQNGKPESFVAPLLRDGRTSTIYHYREEMEKKTPWKTLLEWETIVPLFLVNQKYFRIYSSASVYSKMA